MNVTKSAIAAPGETGGPLRVLHLEDSRSDRELVERALASERLECQFIPASTMAELQSALAAGRFDLILSDFSMPGCDGFEVLALARRECPDVPFVFISGFLGEESAVESLKRGATDYVLKNRMEKLGPAVRRALREADAEARRRAAEAELKRERDLLRALLDHVPDHIFFKDRESRFVKCSRSLSRHLGLESPDEVAGKTDADFYAEAEARALLACEQEILRTGVPAVGRIEARTSPRGVPNWASVTTVPVRGPDGVSAGLIGISHDITEIMQAEDSVRRSEERFREMAENIRDAFWVTTPDAEHFLYVSPAYESIWGVGAPKTPFVAETWLGSVIPEDRERVRAAWNQLAAGGAYRIEYQIARPDGTRRWIEDRGYPVRGKSGAVERIVGAAADITERRRLEDELRQSQKLESIGKLAGGVAHDFNNLLTVINGHASELLETENLGAEMSESLATIYTSGEQAARLVQHLLAFGRKQTVQIRRVDVNEVVNETMNFLQRPLGEKVTVAFSPMAGPAWVEADGGMLEQVLMNLALNARDAMPHGGQLNLSTRPMTLTPRAENGSGEAPSGEFICITVADTGTGIAPAVLPRIFEPFFTTKEPGKGTGLGLSTAFGIVQQHHGWIEVETEVGKGTVFRTYLPKAAGAAPADTPKAPAKPAGGGTETVLLVEDDPSVRNLALAVLRRQGYRVLQAASGEEALEVWQWHAPRIQLLMTDLVMPGELSGFDIAERFQKSKPALKAIFTSGYSDKLAGDVFSVKRKVHFLPKPYRPAALARLVREVLDGKEPG